MADRVNMAHAGTIVVQGRGRAIVTATGMQTELGRIAGLVEQIEEEETPLQQRLDQVGRFIVYITLVIVAIIFGLGILRGDDPVKMFLVAVSLAVAAVPEGLAAVVTIALALGMRRMVKRNALIRRLPAVETLGAATVICSDKTGTLTENEITVREIVLPARTIQVTGEGFSTVGEFFENGKRGESEDDPNLQLALTISALCNTSELQQLDEARYRVIGDPTEGALLIAAKKAGLVDEIVRTHDFITELPFDAVRKRMTMMYEEHIEGFEEKVTQVAYVKGAPDTVLPLCTRIQKRGQVLPLDESTRAGLLRTNTELAAQARRLLAVAYRHLGPQRNLSSEAVERDLVFVGLVGMIDPPRPEAKEAVAIARSAGIDVKMITGDHVDTALGGRARA